MVYSEFKKEIQMKNDNIFFYKYAYLLAYGFNKWIYTYVMTVKRKLDFIDLKKIFIYTNVYF